MNDLANKIYQIVNEFDEPIGLQEICEKLPGYERRTISQALQQMTAQNKVFKELNAGKVYFSTDPSRGEGANGGMQNLFNIANALGGKVVGYDDDDEDDNDEVDPNALQELSDAISDLANLLGIDLDDESEEDDEETEPEDIEITYSQNQCLKFKNYSIKIPDCFSYKKDLDGRDFAAWLDDGITDESDWEYSRFAFAASASLGDDQSGDPFEQSKFACELMRKFDPSCKCSLTEYNHNGIRGGIVFQQTGGLREYNYHVTIGKDGAKKQFRFIINGIRHSDEIDDTVRQIIDGIEMGNISSRTSKTSTSSTSSEKSTSSATTKKSASSTTSKNSETDKKKAAQKNSDDIYLKTSRKFRELTDKIESLKSDWQKDLDEYQYRLSLHDMESEYELNREMRGLRRMQQGHIRNFDRLAGEIDNAAEGFMKEGGDHRVAEGAINAIKKVKREVSDLTLSINAHGTINGEIDSFKAELSSESLALITKWEKRYENSPELVAKREKEQLSEKITQIKKDIKEIEDEIKKMKAYLSSGVSIAEQSAKKDLAAAEDDMKRVEDFYSPKISEQREIIDKITAKSEELKNESERVRAELQKLSIFKVSRKSELKKQLEDLSIQQNKLNFDEMSASDDLKELMNKRSAEIRKSECAKNAALSALSEAQKSREEFPGKIKEKDAKLEYLKNNLQTLQKKLEE